MRNYRHHYDRPVREGYGTRVCEDVDYGDDIPEKLTKEWVRANIPIDATHVDIPDGVKALGSNCFFAYKSLKSVTIPNGVTELGGGCFSFCTSLKSITIPSSVTSIWAYCFCNCESLESITMPSSVTKIGYCCFENCYSLKSITIPNGVTRLEEECFVGCVSLKSITIPSGVMGIENNCFCDCESLKSITIPNSVKSIETSCFHYCKSLKDVYYAGSKWDRWEMRIEDNNGPLLHATWHYNSRGVSEGFYSNRRRSAYRGRCYLRESNDLNGIFADFRDIAEDRLKHFADYEKDETIKEYLESEYYDTYFDRIMDSVWEWLSEWSDDELVEEVGEHLDEFLSVALQADGADFLDDLFYKTDYGSDTAILMLDPHELYYNKWNDTNITLELARGILEAVAMDTIEHYLYDLAKKYNIKLKLY